MAHSFMRVTSNGGCLGRFFWGNTGATGVDGGWGSVHFLRDCKNLQPDTGWAGCIGILRYLTK